MSLPRFQTLRIPTAYFVEFSEFVRAEGCQTNAKRVDYRIFMFRKEHREWTQVYVRDRHSHQLTVTGPEALVAITAFELMKEAAS